MRLAGTGRAHQEDHFGAADPGAGGQGVDPGAFDRRLEGEGEVLQGLAGRQVGEPQRGPDPALLAPFLLDAEQLVEERVRGQLGADRVRQRLLEGLAGMRQPQDIQAFPGGVDVQPGPGPAHRAASARAA